MKVERSYIEQINGDYTNSGLWFEIDEAATEQYYATGSRQMQVKQELKEIEAAKAADTLSTVLNEVVEKRGRKTKKE